MKYQIRKYPLFAACGLNCGLCSRYHTEGTSKCPGCAGEGFLEKHPSCGRLSCCQRKDIDYCFQCADYPCKKYDGADEYDSFITHKNQLRDLEKAKEKGMESYAAELNQKVGLLLELLKDYDDGRRKSFYCLAVNLLDLQDIQSVIEHLKDRTKTDVNVDMDVDVKTRAAAAVRLFTEAAEKKGILLKLRKKTKP